MQFHTAVFIMFVAETT